MIQIYQILIILFFVCILVTCIFSVICIYHTLCRNKKKYNINEDVITNRISTRNEPTNELSTEIVEV
jgi:hypothetical protein